MQIIGINGFKRSGKGETARAVANLLCPEVTIKEVGFADKVKLWGGRSLGLPGTDEEVIALMNEAKEAWEIEVYHQARNPVMFDLTGRQYLQHIGNNARLLFDEDFWVNQVLPQDVDISCLYPGVDVLLLPDLRYENEARRVLSFNNGVVWEVIRPGVESDGHASELPLPRELVNWQIINDGGLDILLSRVSEAIFETTEC